MAAQPDICRTTYPDAYVWSQRDDSSPRRRVYWVASGFGDGRQLLSKGRTAKGAWRSLRNRIQSRVAIMNKEECDPTGKIQEFWDSCPDHSTITFSKKGCLVVSWSERGRGFGEYALFQDRKGKWTIDNECDGREAVKRAFCRLLDSLPLTDPVPERKRAEGGGP